MDYIGVTAKGFTIMRVYLREAKINGKNIKKYPKPIMVNGKRYKPKYADFNKHFLQKRMARLKKVPVKTVRIKGYSVRPYTYLGKKFYIAYVNKR